VTIPPPAWTLVTLGWLLASCTTPAPSPSSTAISATSSLAPVSTLAAPPSESTAVEPCDRKQLTITPGSFGPALGTNYLKLFVELSQGPPCTIPWGPQVTIVARDGSEITRASETSDRSIQLNYITRYYIAWSSSGDCRHVPTGGLAARIEFSPALEVEIPVGAFRPTCVDGANGESLAMYADE
jgi:hypothetical protein